MGSSTKLTAQFVGPHWDYIPCTVLTPLPAIPEAIHRAQFVGKWQSPIFEFPMHEQTKTIYK